MVLASLLWLVPPLVGVLAAGRRLKADIDAAQVYAQAVLASVRTNLDEMERSLRSIRRVVHWVTNPILAAVVRYAWAKLPL